jgi:hypothetical protein
VHNLVQQHKWGRRHGWTGLLWSQQVQVQFKAAGWLTKLRGQKSTARLLFA